MAGKVLKLVPGGTPPGDPLVRRQFASHVRTMRRMGAWKQIKSYGLVVVTDDGSVHTAYDTGNGGWLQLVGGVDVLRERLHRESDG